MIDIATCKSAYTITESRFLFHCISKRVGAKQRVKSYILSGEHLNAKAARLQQGAAPVYAQRTHSIPGSER